MRIAWFSHRGDLGGAELSLFEGVKGLTSRGEKILVVVPSNGDLVHKLNLLGIPTSVGHFRFWTYQRAKKPSFYRRARRLVGHLLAAKYFKGFLRDFGAELVVTNTLTIPVGALAAKWAGIPHIWYIREFGGESQDVGFDYGNRISLYLINKLSERVVFNSRSVAERFRNSIPPTKCRTIDNAVEVPIIPLVRRDYVSAFRVILVGHMTMVKRQEDAIRAIAFLARSGFHVRLTLLGTEDPAYGAYIRNLAREMDVENITEFVPFTVDPFPLMAAADVALMCSKADAFGRVTVEAMKLGKAVIGADSGGTSDIIQNGWNGLLYRPCDPEDLAKKLQILYENRDLLRKLGQTAQEWASQKFNLSSYTSSLMEIFQEVVVTKPNN
jgi:glycosyltransferase involved in cell wall biosynthesis